ncbi:TetR/AcrR family transcriptional regulator [Streptomyces griseoaurantiacus]|uniref:TetR/AcrR family transcriptional regulator n=1 Tax=Streptomyces griseoaurantiacus TaxID=68213 RepID=UPI0017853BCE|nr:TetR family transcriptional regulator [Streptomyces griseoaurantiacus]
MGQRKDAPLRSDAQRNRERILEVAIVELTRRADVPLSLIAREAGVGQGTFYRNFPNRESLVLEIYRHEMQQVADDAPRLLAEREPDRALREWMDGVARFARTKAGLAEAIRLATSGPGSPARPAPTPMMAAADLLLRACQKAGTVRTDVDSDDFMLAVSGLWTSPPDDAWETRTTRLLDLVMDGLRARAPGPEAP